MNNAGTTPIAELNVHRPHWTIRACVASKSEIREWSNPNGTGTLFSVTLRDCQGSTIRATCFNAAVKHWFEVFKVNHCYSISAGRLKGADNKFNRCSSRLEITLDQQSILEPIEPFSPSRSTATGMARRPPIPTKRTNTTTKTSTTPKVGTIMNPGEWSSANKKQRRGTVTPNSDPETPVRLDASLSEDDRRQLRLQRAAAAEQRSNKKRKASSRSRSLTPPRNSMQWKL